MGVCVSLSLSLPPSLPPLPLSPSLSLSISLSLSLCVSLRAAYLPSQTFSKKAQQAESGVKIQLCMDPGSNSSLAFGVIFYEKGLARPWTFRLPKCACDLCWYSDSALYRPLAPHQRLRSRLLSFLQTLPGFAVGLSKLLACYGKEDVAGLMLGILRQEIDGAFGDASNGPLARRA